MIEYTDHTLFKIIEQWVPFKSNTKTGLLIEPHYLDRSKSKRTLPTISKGQTMVSGSYNTFDVLFSPKKVEWDSAKKFKIVTASNNILERLYKDSDKFKTPGGIRIDSSMGGGSVVTTNNYIIPASGQIHSGSDGLRKEQGTNGKIDLSALYQQNQQEAAQAPIKPWSGSKPPGYKKYESNVLMGNIQKGKTSRRYYHSLAIGNQSDLLQNN